MNIQEDKTLHEAGEDYLEAILNLEDAQGNVRSVDVANMLGVSRPSVNKALGILKKMGYVSQQPYGSIRLTDEGRNRANSVLDRHTVIKGFLTKVLGVNPETADEDACRMEHVMSEETMDKLTRYIEKI